MKNLMKMWQEEGFYIQEGNLQKKEDKTVKLQEIKAIAKQKGVKAGSMKKVELIRAIQMAEGNCDCFLTEYVTECGQMNCLWRNDCLEK